MRESEQSKKRKREKKRLAEHAFKLILKLLPDKEAHAVKYLHKEDPFNTSEVDKEAQDELVISIRPSNICFKDSMREHSGPKTSWEV